MEGKPTKSWAFNSLSLCGARGEGWGEGLRAWARVAPPLIRPPATFSPCSAKGEGSQGGIPECKQPSRALQPSPQE